jgi:hypothetical protein
VKTFLLILVTYFSVILFPDAGIKSGMTNSSTGFIDITVQSNIDRQFFQYNLGQQCLSITHGSLNTTSADTSIFRIIIPVKEFRCTNKFVYEDFLDLIKACQFPYLKINIPNNLMISYDNNQSIILKGVTITVAGVSKQYDINCRIDKSDNDTRVLKGTTTLKLTDLEIVPPVKFLGLVKVKNEIVIDFGFCLNNDTGQYQKSED